MFNMNSSYYCFIMLIDLTWDVLPKDDDVVYIETNIIVKDILQNYDHYPVLNKQEK